MVLARVQTHAPSNQDAPHNKPDTIYCAPPPRPTHHPTGPDGQAFRRSTLNGVVLDPLGDKYFVESVRMVMGASYLDPTQPLDINIEALGDLVARVSTRLSCHSCSMRDIERA